MTELKYEDLTPEQKDYLVDGCGHSILDAPDFVFYLACERHDVDYYIGNTKEDRYKADRRMYDQMRAAIKAEPWYRRMWLHPVALTYYFSVRAFGYKYFYYGPKKRTLEDLERDMTS